MCFCCLGWGHQKRFCRYSVRWHVSYNYGHISRDCVTRRKAKICRRKISNAAPPSSGQQNLELPFIPKPSISQTPPHLQPVAAVLAAMANNPIDPAPLVPRGFVHCICSKEEDTVQRVFTFLSTSIWLINKDVAIAILEPVVDLIHCPQVANAIHSFLVNTLHLKNIHIGPSGLGATTVTFDSCLDHQVAMGAPHRMEPY
jgi:hypothetical protein